MMTQSNTPIHTNIDVTYHLKHAVPSGNYVRSRSRYYSRDVVQYKIFSFFFFSFLFFAMFATHIGRLGSVRHPEPNVPITFLCGTQWHDCLSWRFFQALAYAESQG